jgi:hypothetical protein
VGNPDPNGPNNANTDSDCDGLTDAEEFGMVWGGGAQTSPSDRDSDNDGLADGLEVGRTSTPDPRCDWRFSPDTDPSSRTDPTVADSDRDGILDGDEDANHDGARDYGTETDPRNPDSDGDGYCDGTIDVPPVCVGGDTNPLHWGTDADGDGVRDENDPNPNDVDTDGDGLCDGPVGFPGVCIPGEDVDGDGVVDPTETDPRMVDTDCDGLWDGYGQNGGLGEVESGTLPYNADSDGDGLSDGLELGVTSSPDPACTMFVGDQDPTTTTDPLDDDSDNDGLVDGAEDGNQNGRVDGNELDPNNHDDGQSTSTQQACAIPNLVPLDRKATFAADVQIATAVKGGEGFLLTRVLKDSSGDEVGLLGFHAAAGVAYLAITKPPAGANAIAEETAGQATLNAVGAITTPITIANVTWEGFDGVRATYDMAGTVGVKARINAIARRFYPSATGVLPTAGDVVTTDGFKVMAQYVVRSANTAAVLITLQPAGLNVAPASFVFADTGDGSALAQAQDSVGVQCDRFLTNNYSMVDILWAVDNSASMPQEQAMVASAAQTMAAKLSNSSLDWRVAAVTSGFWSKAATPPCLSSVCGEATANQCRYFTSDINVFNTWMTQGQTAWLGAGGTCNVSTEKMLRGAEMILTDPAYANHVSFMPPSLVPDATRLRAGAHLVLVLMGDADDLQYASPTDAGIAAYVSFLRALPVASLTMGGILCIDPSVTCGETQRTPRVAMSVVQQLGGALGNIWDLNSIPPTVDAIMDSVISNVSPYQLSKPAVTSTIKVAMDANATVGACNWSNVPRSRVDGWDYDPRTRRLSFFGGCRPNGAVVNGNIAVSYRYWIDQSRNPDPGSNPCSDCGLCPGLATCDPVTCQCACTATLTCAVNFRWDATACDCVCDPDALNCPSTHQPQTDLCACECKPACGGCPPGTFCRQSICYCEDG